MAYFNLRRAALTSDPGALDAASDWITLAERQLHDGGAFVVSGESHVFPDSRRPPPPPSSLYFGEAGVWCAAALVAGALCDEEGARRAVGRFGSVADGCADDELDAVSGAASLLLGTAVLIEALGDPPARELLPVGERLADRLTAAVAGRGRTSGEPIELLGAAHGWCGLAHALLRWCQATDSEPSPALRGLLDELRETRLASGLWPRREGSTEVWPGWCHGSAGWTQLWTLAWEVLRQEDLLELAEPAAVDAVGAGDAGGGGLCCGQAGQGYAALAMYRATDEDSWLTGAQRLAAEAARTPLGEWFPEHSLWRGDLGAALLILELSQPRQAAMPLYRALA